MSEAKVNKVIIIVIIVVLSVILLFSSKKGMNATFNSIVSKMVLLIEDEQDGESFIDLSQGERSNFIRTGSDVFLSTECGKVSSKGINFTEGDVIMNTSSRVFKDNIGDNTICLWYKLVPERKDEQKLIMWRDSQNYKTISLYEGSNDVMIFRQYDSTSGTLVTTANISGLSDGWHFSCFVSDEKGESILLYIDNQIIDVSQEYNSPQGMSDNKFIIGSDYDFNKHFFGCIGQIIGFDDNLTKEEMDYLYNNGNGKSLRLGCTDDCTVDGEKECTNNTLKICGDYDLDVCLEWDTVICEFGCDNGTCKSQQSNGNNDTIQQSNQDNQQQNDGMDLSNLNILNEKESSNNLIFVLILVIIIILKIKKK